MKFVSNSIGHEISAVLYGVDKKLINDSNFLKKVIMQGLKKDKFHILKDVDYVFSPQGYTLNVLLSESHVAIHTYPEHGSIYFGLYSCKCQGHGKKTYEHFVKKLKPKNVVVDMREVIVKE